MLSRDGSRSIRTALLTGMLTLAFIAPALGQAVPPAAPLPSKTEPPTADGVAPSPPPVPTQEPSAALPPVPPSPANTTPAANGAVPDNGLLAYSLADVPDMIGDGHYVLNGLFNSLGRRQTATIPIAGGDSYFKIADDTSPIPTDRVFFDYNYFNHAVQTGNGATVGLNRFTFGVEKTFLDGSCSIELRAPLETGLNNAQFVDGTTAENQGTVFGNLSLVLKCLAYQSASLALSIGTAVDLPTAPNGSFDFLSDPVTIRNESVHVSPFFGAAYVPNSNFFATGFVQLDFDTNGDPVDETFEESDPRVGRLRDPSLLYLDLSMGYWLFRDEPWFGRYVTGIAPIVELHYTTTLQNYHGADNAIVPLFGGTDCLNLTAGLHFQMGPRSMLTVGGTVPLMASLRDREFDSEAVVEFDRRF